jgi:hypothetical protein
MLWFVCGASILKLELNVLRLLRSWGGEALYNSHEQDPVSWPTLRSLGKACIIKCRLLPQQINLPRHGLGAKIEEAFLQNRGVSTPNDPQFDTHMKQTLPAEQILNIIEKDDPEFLSLTDYETWSEDF